MDSLSFHISQIFSYIIIYLAFTMKIPQIYELIKKKTVKGISLNSLYLDLLNQYFMFMYAIYRKKSIKIWGECLSIGIQNLIIIFLYWYYEPLENKQKNANRKRLLSAGILIINICLGFLTNIYPEFIWVGFALTNLPSVFTSRYYQINFLIKTKDSGSLSGFSFAMRFIKNFMKVFYYYVQESDFILMFNQTYNGCLSLYVFCLIKYYSKPDDKDKIDNDNKVSEGKCKSE